MVKNMFPTLSTSFDLRPYMSGTQANPGDAVMMSSMAL